MNTKKYKTLAVDLLYDFIGSVLFGLGVYTFAKGGQFAPGGVSGIALMINHVFPRFPIGTLTLVLNVPIVLLSFKVIGKHFLLKSFRTMLISTIIMDFVLPLVPLYSGNRLLAAVFSGVLLGAGLALIYMRGSSTGGMDFLNLSIKKLKPHLSIGQVTLVTDGLIILAGGAVFGDIDAVLYGMVATFAATTMIDKMMYGAGSGKMAMIITQHAQEIADVIGEEVDRGSTMIKAMGSYSGEERTLLLCVAGKREVFKVRNIAYTVDPACFVTICEASEVFGEGFSSAENT